MAPLTLLYKHLTRHAFLDLMASASKGGGGLVGSMEQKERLVAAWRVYSVTPRRRRRTSDGGGQGEEDEAGTGLASGPGAGEVEGDGGGGGDAGGPEGELKSRILAISLRKGTKIRIHKIKAERYGNFTIQHSFGLDELKSIESAEGLEIKLQLGAKTYEWALEHADAKSECLLALVHLSTRMSRGKGAGAPGGTGAGSKKAGAAGAGPAILNTNLDLLRDSIKFAETPSDIQQVLEYVDEVLQRQRPGGGHAGSQEGVLEGEEDASLEQQELDGYGQNLDLDEILRDLEAEVGGDASAIEARLALELMALEAANIHAIIQSDQQATLAVAKVDRGLVDLGQVHEWITTYTHLLDTMGQDVHQIELQNKSMQIVSNNLQLLRNEILGILNAMKVPSFVVEVLRNEPFTSTDSITSCEEAIGILMKVLHLDMGEYQGLKAVTERIILFSGYANNFANRLITYVLTHFSTLGEMVLERQRQQRRPTQLRASMHETLEERLMKFRALFRWLHEFKERKHADLQAQFAQEMSKVYTQEVREFLDGLKACLVKPNPEFVYIFSYVSQVNQGLKGTALAALDKMVDKSKGFVRMTGTKKRHSNPTGTVEEEDVVYEDWRRTYPLRLRNACANLLHDSGEERLVPEEAFEATLLRLVPMMVRMQNFTLELFALDVPMPAGPEPTGGAADRPSFVALREPVLGDALGDILPLLPDAKLQKRLQELSAASFESVSEELHSLIEFITTLDPTYAITLATCLEETAALLQGSRYTHAHAILDGALKKALSIFDKFIGEQVKDIDNTKVALKKRSGILSFVRVFALFVDRMEGFLCGADAPIARAAVSRGYTQVVRSIFETLAEVAQLVQNDSKSMADDKDQLNIHILMVENMHHFYTELQSRKALGVELFINEAKQLYDVHLDAYSKAVIRRVLGRLLEFFEGVEDLLKTAPPQEVSFHLQYNRNSLRDVLKKSPSKEVKKGLDTLFKRVDKHFSDDILLQVVWHGIEEEFMYRLNRYEELISLCYPESSLRLEFTVEEIQDTFGSLKRE